MGNMLGYNFKWFQVYGGAGGAAGGKRAIRSPTAFPIKRAPLVKNMLTCARMPMMALMLSAIGYLMKWW